MIKSNCFLVNKKGGAILNQALRILRSLTKIQERSGLFRHGTEEVFDGFGLAEVHCIDKIGSIEYANVTKVANEMDMTRGAISKITKKLLHKGIIDSYQRPGNHKEVYFSLTEKGKHIYDEHKKCHSQSEQEKLWILEPYDEHEQSIILRFLNDINLLYERKFANEITEKE